MLTREQIQQNINALEKQGASQQEIQQWLNSLKSSNNVEPEKKSVGGFIKNIGSSGVDFVKGIGTAIAHPIKTVETIGNIGAGALEKVMPMTGDTKEFDATVDFFKNRYGSIDKLKETMYEDPVGFAADLSVFLGGAEASLAKAGQVSKVRSLSKAANVVGKVNEFTNPASLVSKGVGYGTSKVGSGIKKIASPLKNSFDSETANIAKQTGVDLPMSSLSSSKPLQAAEAIASKGLFGNKIADKIEIAGQKITQLADDVVNSMEGTTDTIRIGEMAVEGTNKFKEVWTKTKNELFKEAVIPKAGNKKAPAITINPSESLAFVKEILDQKVGAAEILGKASDLKFFKTLEKTLSEPGIKAFKFKTAIQELNKKLFNQSDPLIVTGNRGIIKQLAAKMDNDLDAALIKARPDLKLAIEKANEYYKSGLDKMNGAYGKVIKQNADRPEKIADMLMKKAVPSDIGDMEALIGKSAADSVKKSYVEKIINSAKSGTDGNLTKAKFTNVLNRNAEMLKTVLSPEQYTSLQKIEKLLGAFKQGTAVANNSVTAFVASIMLPLKLLVSAPLVALKTILGDKLFAKFMASKGAEKWLTEGYNVNPDKVLNKITPSSGTLQAGFQAGRMEDLNE